MERCGEGGEEGKEVALARRRWGAHLEIQMSWLPELSGGIGKDTAGGLPDYPALRIGAKTLSKTFAVMVVVVLLWMYALMPQTW